MAHIFSHASKSDYSGDGIDEWLKKNITENVKFSSGDILDCVDISGNRVKCNRSGVGLIMSGSRIEKHKSLIGLESGSKISGGDLYYNFVDIRLFREIFVGSSVGILEGLDRPFFIPIGELNDDTKTFILEAYAEYVSQRHGGIRLDETHIANGMSNIIKEMIYRLTKEIVLNGKEPNKERLYFMLEALHALSLSALSASKYSKTIKKIFCLMPYVINSCDVLESISMVSLMDEVPNDATLCSLIGLGIKRYFKFAKMNKMDISFVTNIPTGIIAIFLSTTLATLVSSRLENHEVINLIIESINGAIIQITSSITVDMDIHTMNKYILTSFAGAFDIKLINPSLVDKIYDAVVAGSEDICKSIGIDMTVPFMNDMILTLNGKAFSNKVNRINDDKFIASDPNMWAGISLKIGDYKLCGTTLGNADFGYGNTLGKGDIANIRVTLGEEIFAGSYDGLSITGIKYSASNKSFKNIGNLIKLNPNKEFIISSRIDGVHILQDGVDIMCISNKGNMDITPLVCFKYCRLEIKCQCITSLVEQKAQIDPSIQEKEIKSCLSLSDALSGLQVSNTSRKSSDSRIWGQVAVAKLKSNM